MARKGRFQFPGAIYHVLNRGNYRRDIFEEDGTRAAFEDCLFAACKKSSWLLHAFVIMRNHFHMAVETPEGNLVPGMQWLQATFANRFNRFRGERGHLFQGRYKSFLVDVQGKTLGQLCDYIHLNPAAAKITDIAGLAAFRWSSYWYLHRRFKRPPFLRPETALVRSGIPTDDISAWALYADRLALQLQTPTHDIPRNRANHRHPFESGWVLGSEEFKKAMAERDNASAVARYAGACGAEDLRQHQWSLALDKALAIVGRSRADAAAEPKSARWKLAVAAWLKQTTQARNRWLSTQLNLGSPYAFSHNLTTFMRLHRPSDPDFARLTAIY